VIGTFAWCVAFEEGGQTFMFYRSRYPIKENNSCDIAYIRYAHCSGCDRNSKGVVFDHKADPYHAILS